MKKVICVIFGTIFYILGFIGLLLPVIPQVPFFIIGTFFFFIGSKKIIQWITNTKFYKKYIKDNVSKSRLLSLVFK